ncbi:HNH endonuclease [Rapidithrix thailandica]|uniref:Putative HNH nuclease YajD n=1 Tax=Rapidithrix thailandica TaxID=413964 RepID=A0AAW9SD59_9BACT
MPRLIKKKRERWWARSQKTGRQAGRKEKSKFYHTSRWRKLARQILIRDNYLCQACKRKGVLTAVGEKPRDHAIDHIQAVRQGGDFWDPHNLETLCAGCHNRKSGKERHQA